MMTDDLIKDPYDRARADRADGPGPPEPSDLDLAIIDRLQMRICPFGPLTRDEQEAVDAHERYMEEEEAEFKAMEAAGGRTICPECGKRSVKHRSVCTLGYPGHPGAEFSDLAECENCDYKEL